MSNIPDLVEHNWKEHGSVKERITYCHENGTAYQAVNSSYNTGTIMVYVKDDNRYVLCAYYEVDHIITKEELEKFAIEREALYKQKNIPSDDPFKNTMRFKQRRNET